jgi:hypothetical protein
VPLGHNTLNVSRAFVGESLAHESGDATRMDRRDLREHSHKKTQTSLHENRNTGRANVKLAVFEDNVYRQKSEMDGFKTEILSEPEKTPHEDASRGGGHYRTGQRVKAEHTPGFEFLKNQYKKVSARFLPGKTDAEKRMDFIN